MYQVVLAQKVGKDLKQVGSEKRCALLTALVKLGKDPYLGKKLVGKYQGCYSLRVWPLRIIYQVYPERLTILVIRIGHRSKVYQ